MSSNQTLPILIAGAGPTGLTAALELNRFDIPVRIIDKEDAPATTSRAIGVQARTLELMEMRGLADEFVRLGVHASHGNVYGGGKRVFQLDFSRLDSHYQYILLLSQTETERILRERLEQRGVVVERGLALSAFRQDESSITAVLQHKQGQSEEYEAAYLIDCEGAHSVARATLGLDFEGKTLKQNFLLGDLHADSEISDVEVHIFSSEHGLLALFPLGPKHFRLIADQPINKSQTGAPTLEECQSVYDQRSPVPARFYDLTWSSYFHINSRMASRMHSGRVFLGGDAAHIHSPAGAQGMNTGIQDMINLGWKMAYTIKGYAGSGLLDTYEEDRGPVIANVLRQTEELTSAIGSESKLFRGLFNHLVPLIGKLEVVQETGVERMSQLAVGYRTSSLSEDHGPSHGIRAGDRVPDVAVSVEGGQTTRLFKLLHPSKMTLLVIGQAQSSQTGKLREALGSFASQNDYLQFFSIATTAGDKTFQLPETAEHPLFYLIRPDGYVGFRGRAGNIDRLGAYMMHWLSVRQPAASVVAP